MPTAREWPPGLFMHELPDVYYGEKQLVKRLPTMIDEAADTQLSSGLQTHSKG